LATIPNRWTIASSLGDRRISSRRLAAEVMAEETNSAGSDRRVSLHTGTAVLDSSTAVYPDIGRPTTPAA
jgi:hypothetical protein